MNLTFLTLPPLIDSIKIQLEQVIDKVETRNFIVPWLQNFHAPTAVASQEYGNQRTQIPLPLLKEIVTYYKPYFQEEFLPLLAVTDSISGAASCTPPHCDKIRQTAINYLLASGGDAVTTTFYRETRTSSSLDLADHSRYENVTVDQQMVIPLHQWHAFDVQKFHSVENITGRRCILSLILKSNPSFQEFVTKYQTLVAD